MDSKLEAYLTRRIRELTTEGKTESEIDEQLDAITWASGGTRKQLRELIKRVLAA